MSGSRANPAIEVAANPESQSSIFSRRSRRQLGMFFAGATFLAVSTAITRRSLVRRYKATIPKFYQQSNQPNKDVNGAVEAFDALSIATINVFSVSIMCTGGLLWAFDISTLDEMRQKLRRGMGAKGEGQTAKEADEEMEEWLATVLARKDKKDKRAKEVEALTRSGTR